MFQGSFKGVSRMFHGSFNDVLRKFQGCLKIVSSVLLHESHRSYPSRRRACFKMVKILHFCSFIAQVVNKVLQGSLFEVRRSNKIFYDC